MGAEPAESFRHRADEAAGAEGAALDPAPAVSDVKPFLVDGRSYVARTDGSRIPLLTRAELEGTVSRAFGAFDAEGQLIAGKLEMMATPPPSYNLSVFQTPVKNQMDRGEHRKPNPDR